MTRALPAPLEAPGLSEAVLVTNAGRRAGLLAVDERSNDGLPVLVVDDVRYAPEDLPAGAYLLVNDPAMADQAGLAGYFLEPAGTFKRKLYRLSGKSTGILLLVGAAWGLVWAVRHALELDLVGAVAWLGLSLFIGFLGFVWWGFGQEELLEEDAKRRIRFRKLSRLAGLLRR